MLDCLEDLSAQLDRVVHVYFQVTLSGKYPSIAREDKNDASVGY